VYVHTEQRTPDGANRHNSKQRWQDRTMRRFSPPSASGALADLEAALDALYSKERVVLSTTERTVVGRLLVHADRVSQGRKGCLEEGGHTWDIEYSKASGDPKVFQIRHRTAVGEGRSPGGRLFSPDLLWHRRLLAPSDGASQKARANVVAVEVKLEAFGEALRSDWAKLALLTGTVSEVHWFKGALRMEGQDGDLVRRPRYGVIGWNHDVAGGLYRHGVSLNLNPEYAEVYLFHGTGRRPAAGSAPRRLHWCPTPGCSQESAH
jgi:hypothetical protein